METHVQCIPCSRYFARDRERWRSRHLFLMHCSPTLHLKIRPHPCNSYPFGPHACNYNYPLLPKLYKAHSLYISKRYKSIILARMSSTTNTMAPEQVSQGKDVSSQAIILEPIQEGGMDVLLLFIPGAYTAAQEYFSLLKSVQKLCGFRLWVAILDPGNSVVDSSMIEASIDGMIRRVKEHGFVPGELSISKIFIAGHSWGAWCARSIAKKLAEGFIQMGSFFHTNPDNLAQYPKPVLTLGGALDGQLRLAGMVKHAGEIYLAEPQMGDFNTCGLKPVVIIPGMNHAQFSHGIPNKERGDMDAEITIEHARSQVAELVASFLRLHIGGQEEQMQLALEHMNKCVKKTHGQYMIFWEAIENQDIQAKTWQLQVAALSELKEENVTIIKHDYLENFVYSKPWIDTRMKRIFVQVYLSPADKYSIIKNIWIKMKSKEAIYKSFGKSDNPPTDVSGAEFNAETFHQALSLTPVAQRKKFYEQGRKLRFVEDLVVKTSAQDWIDSDVVMKPAQDGSNFVDVQCPVVTTPVEGVASRFAGMRYMKLLSVARCIEWILLDSFR